MKTILTFILTAFSLIIYAQPFDSRADWENYFRDNINNLDPIEGIWDLSNEKVTSADGAIVGSSFNQSVLQLAIYKTMNGFQTASLENNELQFYYRFNSTSISDVYLIELHYFESSASVKSRGVLTKSNLLEFSYDKPRDQLKEEFKEQNREWVEHKVHFNQQWIKVSPTNSSTVTTSKRTGTGFSITQDGIIVTNFHVISNSSAISIRGLNGDFSKSYPAKVIAQDSKNDIALLKLIDNDFQMLKQIPFTIVTETSKVGVNVFALGYPLLSSMGEEVKLTNGIISSNSGYQGDITSYQISVPVQPGNSGGPMFDNDGNLVGIINAKHLGAENVSYAVKSIYLKLLIDSINDQINLPQGKALIGKNLSSQISLIKDFVYIIEVE